MTKEEILLKEWERNVDLYIDQDKRGIERIKMFLLIHAGLFALYGTMCSNNTSITGKRFLLCLVAIAGLYITRVTKRMSVRAHSYILLRRVQGMLIEKKLQKLLSSNEKQSDVPDVLTTFTREHIVFASIVEDEEKKWKNLKTEIKDELSEYAAKPFETNWDKYLPVYEFIKQRKCYKKFLKWYKSLFKKEPQPTIGHLAWLIRIYATLYVLWVMLFVFAILLL